MSDVMNTNVGGESCYRVSGRALKALDDMDRMPDGLRACVHEFGSEIVNQFLTYGISDPVRIRALTYSCWCGARSAQQRTGFGKKSAVLSHLDWVLSQAGAEITAHRLLRVLWEAGMAVVPSGATNAMVEASMAVCSNHNMRVTKQRKHELRVQAAIKAGVKQQWPFLFQK